MYVASAARCGRVGVVAVPRPARPPTRPPLRGRTACPPLRASTPRPRRAGSGRRRQVQREPEQGLVPADAGRARPVQLPEALGQVGDPGDVGEFEPRRLASIDWRRDAPPRRRRRRTPTSRGSRPTRLRVARIPAPLRPRCHRAGNGRRGAGRPPPGGTSAGCVPGRDGIPHVVDRRRIDLRERLHARGSPSCSVVCTPRVTASSWAFTSTMSVLLWVVGRLRGSGASAGGIGGFVSASAASRRCTTSARELGAERVEVRLPESAERIEPRVRGLRAVRGRRRRAAACPRAERSRTLPRAAPAGAATRRAARCRTRAGRRRRSRPRSARRRRAARGCAGGPDPRGHRARA